MTVLILAAFSIIALLTLRHIAVTRFLLGPRQLKIQVTIEDGRKRLNPSSAFLTASTLWIVFGIYLYVYRGLVYEKIQTALSVLQMPESLRQPLLSLPLIFWGCLTFGLTALLVGWFFFAASRGRLVTMGTKGLAIGDYPYTWQELSNLMINEKQLCFFVKKQSHHYSWKLTAEQVHSITANLPKSLDSSQE